ncbi:MAG: type 4a pilus biogenesis protein PilO, partial [Planctomycetota bacterium]
MGNLSEKQLFLIVIAVALLVSGGFGVLSFLEYQKIGEVGMKIEAVQKEIAGYQVKEKQIQILENDLTYMRPRHTENKKALPEWRFDDALLKGIQAQATAAKVKIKSVSPETTRGRGRAAASVDPWDSFSMTIDVEGRYFDLMKFMNLLEHYPRLLSLKSGMFRVSTRTGGGARGKTVSAEEEKEGPNLGLKLDIEAYVVKKAPVAPPRPKKPAAGKKGAGKAPAKGKAKPKPKPRPVVPQVPAVERPPEGEVFKDIQIPDKEVVKVENRRNPFVIWLDKVVEEKTTEGGEPVVPLPKDTEEIEKLLENWKERLNKITVMQAHRDKPKETYFEWKKLVKEVTRTKLDTPFAARREEILQSLLAEGFQSQILAEYDSHLEQVARQYRIRMEDGQNVGMPGEVCIAFKEFLAEILSGDRLPTRVRREFKTTMQIFLDTMKDLVEEEGDYKFVLSNISEVQKIITDEWKQKPFIKEFLAQTEEYRAKAQALVEFFSFDILVSGLVWLPTTSASKRVAIVNDMAVLEGDTVPVKRAV